LNFQNIDDRYIFNWNNIRIIGKKEQDIHEYVLLKDEINDNNVLSLNINNEGVSVIGSNFKTSNENQDKSVSHFEINKDNNKEIVYQKDINIMSMDNLQNQLMNELKHNKRSGNYDNNYYSNNGDAYSFKSVKDRADNEDNDIHLKDNYHINPCFNKGYYNDETKMIGKGNYTECYGYMDRIMNDDNINTIHINLSPKVLNSLKTNNHVIHY
jgi:hypothetical protein